MVVGDVGATVRNIVLDADGFSLFNIFLQRFVRDSDLLFEIGSPSTVPITRKCGYRSLIKGVEFKYG